MINKYDELEKLLKKQFDSPKDVLHTKELTDLSDKYLSAKAKEALSKKSKTLNYQDDNGSYRCAYFSTVVRRGYEEKGVEAISKVINELAEMGVIHSCLVPVSSIALAKIPLGALQSTVFCFVLIPENKHEEVSTKYKEFYTLEGGVGNIIDDPNLGLKDGEFLSVIRFSHSMLLIKNSKSIKERLHDEIDLYLAVLPKGTKVMEITQCAITDTSYAYEIKFFNPLFKNIKRIELSWKRNAEIVDDHLEPFNLLTRILYFDNNDKELF